MRTLTKPMLGLFAALALQVVDVRSQSDDVCSGSCDDTDGQYSCLMQKTFTKSRAAGSPPLQAQDELEDPSSLMQVFSTDKLPSEMPEEALVQDPVTLEDLEVMMGARPAEVEAPLATSAAEPVELVAWTASSPGPDSVLAQAEKPENPAGLVVHIHLNSELQEGSAKVIKDPPEELAALKESTSQTSIASSPVEAGATLAASSLDLDASSLMQVASPDRRQLNEPLSLLQSNTNETSISYQSTSVSWGWLEALHLSREAHRHREPTGTLYEAMILGIGFCIVGLAAAIVLGMFIKVLLHGDKKEEVAEALRSATA